ncbi:MAG: hypothetical protein ACYC6R_05805 [Anaerolineales bacterium]
MYSRKQVWKDDDRASGSRSGSIVVTGNRLWITQIALHQDLQRYIPPDKLPEMSMLQFQTTCNL